MVLLLRTWVCDLCDAERRIAQLQSFEPYEDPDYQPVASPEDETGDAEWANVQLQKGRAVEFVKCDHVTSSCTGWQYRYYRRNVERRHLPDRPRWEIDQSMVSPDHKAFSGRNWINHRFRIVPH